MRGDVLSRRVGVDCVVRFAHVFQDWDHGVVLVQYQAVVQVCIYPRLRDVANVGEVDDHAARVGFVGFDVDFDAPVVPVQMSTLAVVLQESVSVAEVNATGDAVSRQGCVLAKRGRAFAAGTVPLW